MFHWAMITVSVFHSNKPKSTSILMQQQVRATLPFTFSVFANLVAQPAVFQQQRLEDIFGSKSTLATLDFCMHNYTKK